MGTWFTPRCKVVDKSKLNCVTGQSEIVYIVPEIANKTGNCKHYNESKQKVLWNEIKELLEEYDQEIFMKYHGDYTRWSEYFAMDELRKVLDEPREWKDNTKECSEPKKKKKHWWTLGSWQ